MLKCWDALSGEKICLFSFFLYILFFAVGIPSCSDLNILVIEHNGPSALRIYYPPRQ
jgi:hypothetical protein